MNTNVEEPEIKIEYYESLESDPLHDNTDLDITEDVEDDTASQEDTIVTPNATWYRTINSLGRFICKFCDQTYSTVQTLRYHAKIKHPGQASDLKTAVLNNKRSSKLKCHVCKKRFKLLVDLEVHVQTEHIKNMNIACPFCHATFEHDSDILTHMLHKHGKLKSNIHSCFICGYQTSKLSHFKQHNNTHSSIKSKKCKNCDYSTNYLPNLKIHEQIHSEIRPYCCDFKGCSYRSATKSALRSHQLKHNTDNKLLYCDKCSYKTVYKQSLKKHIDSHSRNSKRIRII